MDHRLPVVMNGQRYGHGNPISESSADDWALTALHREVDSETERRFDAVGARIAEPFDQRAEEVALIALDIGVVEQVARKDCGFPAAILGAERDPCIGVAKALHAVVGRSEEHTSELQSLMRNSYAVFCFKKKKNTYPLNSSEQ